MERSKSYSKEQFENEWKSISVEERAEKIWAMTAKKDTVPFSELEDSLKKEFIQQIRESEEENGITSYMALCYYKYYVKKET